MAHKRFDDRIEVAFDKGREIVKRDFDAMIGHAVLGKIVGADFLAAFAGADLGAALGRVTRIFLANFAFEQPRAEDGEGARFVLLLRALIGATDNEPGRFMDDLNGGVGCVDALAAGT